MVPSRKSTFNWFVPAQSPGSLLSFITHQPPSIAREREKCVLSHGQVRALDGGSNNQKVRSPRKEHGRKDHFCSTGSNEFSLAKGESMCVLWQAADEREPADRIHANKRVDRASRKGLVGNPSSCSSKTPTIADDANNGYAAAGIIIIHRGRK